MVSGSGICAKQVVVDARHHMLGRLASIVAKDLLNGQRVVVVLCEEIRMSGGLVRQKMKYLRFLHLRQYRKTKMPRRRGREDGGEGEDEELWGTAFYI